MGAIAFITIIETRLDPAISINPVLGVGTADTIELKKPVLCAKKKIIDQSIIFRKNAIFSEIELKTVFEKNITITRPNVILERISLIMKTRISS